MVHILAQLEDMHTSCRTCPVDIQARQRQVTDLTAHNCFECSVGHRVPIIANLSGKANECVNLFLGAETFIHDCFSSSVWSCCACLCPTFSFRCGLSLRPGRVSSCNWNLVVFLLAYLTNLWSCVCFCLCLAGMTLGLRRLHVCFTLMLIFLCFLDLAGCCCFGVASGNALLHGAGFLFVLGVVFNPPISKFLVSFSQDLDVTLGRGQGAVNIRDDFLHAFFATLSLLTLSALLSFVRLAALCWIFFVGTNFLASSLFVGGFEWQLGITCHHIRISGTTLASTRIDLETGNLPCMHGMVENCPKLDNNWLLDQPDKQLLWHPISLNMPVTNSHQTRTSTRGHRLAWSCFRPCSSWCSVANPVNSSASLPVSVASKLDGTAGPWGGETPWYFFLRTEVGRDGDVEAIGDGATSWAMMSMACVSTLSTVSGAVGLCFLPVQHSGRYPTPDNTRNLKNDVQFTHQVQWDKIST